METNLTPQELSAWIAAMQSGCFLRCTGSLKARINGKAHYCPLGVLARTLKIMGPYLHPADGRILVIYEMLERRLGRATLDAVWRLNDNPDTPAGWGYVAAWVEENLRPNEILKFM